MIVAHPADGDEAMTGRKSTTTNHLAGKDPPTAFSLCRCVVVLFFMEILSVQMSELWRV